MKKNKINKQGKLNMVVMVILFLTLHLSPFILNAQEMTANAPSKVYAGDNFTVRFVVNDKCSDFHAPSMDGFVVRSGPNVSTSSSYSFGYGQSTSSVQTTYSFTLNAPNAGTFTIGPASCTVDGKKVSSKSVTITVEKMSAAQQQQRQQQQQQQQSGRYDPWAQQPQTKQQLDEKSVFARASVSKSNPYQGEQIIVTYKIYTQVPISQFAIDKLPGNRGFWAEDLSVGQQFKQYEEVVDGRRYSVAEIRRGALFAQESGSLTIEPLELDVLAMVKQQRRRTGSIWDLFDDPFFSAQQAVTKSLKTNRVNVNVRPLPSAPDGFNGAVGNFSIDGGLNLKSVKANEAVTYRLTVSGNGNLMLISAPQPDFPNVFEAYDPQVTDNIKKGDSGISGSRTFEWVLIPRTMGNYTIPAMEFVFFDPKTGQYVRKNIEEQQLKVEKGDPHATGSSYSKDDVKVLAQDISYIHPITSIKAKQSTLSNNLVFFIVAAAIVVLSGIVILVGRKRSAAAQDIAGMRTKRATRLARRRLKKAAAYLGPGNTERFYEEIYRAIWGCLADKYNIELSQLNRDTVSSCLEEKQVPANRQEDIMKLLQDVDIARFAPGDPEQHKKSIYAAALNVIANL